MIQPHTVGSVRIAWYQGDQRQALFDVQVSATGGTWSTVHSGRSSGTTTGFEAVDFADSTTAFAVGCTTNIGSCTQAAVVKIDFPPVEFLPEETSSSELPVLALVLVGAAALVAAGGFLLARRR